MSQPNIMGPKRRLNHLHLQPSNLESTYKYLEPNRPGTPYPKRTNGWKRPASFIGQDDAPKKEEVKKRKTTNHPLVSFPSLDSEHSPSSPCCNISSMELMRALKSILNQVDWLEVALDVVGEEKSTIYRDAFKKLIQAHIKEIIKQEGYREDREEKDTPKYMKCPDTDSKDDNGDNGIRKGSKSFDDKSFVVIDEENEYESGGYEDDDEEDDEEDEEEDEDDEDQEDEDDDEDYEDGLSV